jgi:hypothetical protein
MAPGAAVDVVEAKPVPAMVPPPSPSALPVVFSTTSSVMVSVPKLLPLMPPDPPRLMPAIVLLVLSVTAKPLAALIAEFAPPSAWIRWPPTLSSSPVPISFWPLSSSIEPETVPLTWMWWPAASTSPAPAAPFRAVRLWKGLADVPSPPGAALGSTYQVRWTGLPEAP